MKRALSLAAALAALAGCSFAPKTGRPDAGYPAAHRYPAKADPRQVASIADLPWWEVFDEPGLQALIREALVANDDLRIAVARVEEARAFAGVARADFWPQVNAQLGGQYGQLQSKKAFPGAGETGAWSAGLGVSWEIDLWGRVRNGSDAAVADLLATEEGRRGVILSLISATAQAYFELRGLELELEVDRANVLTRRETLELFENRARGGVASDLEVNQARADLAVTTGAVPATELAIAQKEHQLCILVGRPPGPIERGAPIMGWTVPPELPPGVPASLLDRRPDLRAAEQAIRAEAARVGVAVANRLPALTLSGLIGLSAPTVPGAFSADALVWNAGGSLLAPIFQGGRLSSLEEAQRARLDQAVAAYHKAARTALREVADASIAARKTREVKIEGEKEVQAARESVRLVNLRYQGGVSSYLEVLDAQRRVFDAEVRLTRVHATELTTAVALYRALGGGWQEEPAAARPAPEPGAQEKPAAN